MRFIQAGVVALALCASIARAQTPPPAVNVSFGVDTTAADVGDIVRLVRAYLAQPDTSAGTRGLWSTANAFDRRVGDLHRYSTYQGFPATILGVLSAGPGDSAYVVKVIYARADSAGEQVMPLALQRLYAVRAPAAPFGWQLSNALPRLTTAWPTTRAGRITFHYAPGQRPNPKRAARAAHFVDSVATLFDVPPPPHIDCYVTASPDEYYRAIGLDFFPLPSGRTTATGGNTFPQAAIVLAGDPAQGEAYLHEFVHAVLMGGIGGGGVLGEGVPTWLAGSKGRSRHAMYDLLIAYQLTHPDVTVAALVRREAGWGSEVDDALSATGALFVETVFRRSGAKGLRALKGTPHDPDTVLAAMAHAMGLPADDPEALDRWWRHESLVARGRR